MKNKLYLIALFAIFCVQGIWAQTENEEPDSIFASREIINEVPFVEPKEEGPQVYNDSRSKAYVKGKGRVAQSDPEQIAEELDAKQKAIDYLRNAQAEDDPMADFWVPKKGRFAYNLYTIIDFKGGQNNAGIAQDVSGVNADKFSDAEDDADPGSSWGVGVGALFRMLYGTRTAGGFKPNPFGIAFDLGFLVDAHKSRDLSIYNALLFIGVTFRCNQPGSVSLRAYWGTGTSVGYAYDLDNLDEMPQPDPKSTFKTVFEVALGLGKGQGKGSLLPGRHEFFVGVEYASDKDTYDPELRIYRFCAENALKAGLRLYF